MSKLDEFEQSKKEVYQVTQREWIDIMHDQHVIQCHRTEEEFNKYTMQEVQCFHKLQVREALKQGIEVPENVLADYPTLKQEVENKLKAEQERYNSQVPLTAELLNVLQNGTKLTINNTKCTVYKKTENSLIIKLYKARTKGVELFLNERFNQFSIGWNT